MIVTAGSTNVSVYFYIVGDASHASPGDPITGLVFSDIETGGSASYMRQGAARVDFTLVTLASASAAHTDGGFILVDDTNMPGVYRCDVPDAAFATGVDQVVIHLVAASSNNAAIAPIVIDITDVDLRDSVRGGLTALPNAAADAAGGLPISDAGGLDLDGVLSGNTPQTGDAFARLAAYNLDKLLTSAVVGTDVTDDSVFARLVSSSATADWDTYVNTTDSLQAIRDRGDSAWTTGGGGSITDIVSWKMLIPPAIDLANTKAWRLGIALTNQLDDLPTTLEITPGTISIDRAAQGGTTWAAVVTDAACSESAGLIYYDEVFDTATGYVSGDVIRITFKGQKVTVSSNDYEITDGTNGIIQYTGIIADTPDVNVASINGSTANVAAMNLFFSIVNSGTGQLDSGSFMADAITAAAIQDGALTSGKFADGFLTGVKFATDAITASALAADAVTEIQSGLSTASAVAAVQTTADAIETDTQNIQGRLPTALSSNGNIPADMQEINNVPVTGNGQSGTEFSV